MEGIFSTFPAIIKGLDQNEAAAEALVFAAWKHAVGEPIRARTSPLEFANRRLIVAVEDETWRRNLATLAPQMVARLNASLGERTVTFVEFRVDPTLNYGR